MDGHWSNEMARMSKLSIKSKPIDKRNLYLLSFISCAFLFIYHVIPLLSFCIQLISQIVVLWAVFVGYYFWYKFFFSVFISIYWLCWLLWLRSVQLKFIKQFFSRSKFNKFYAGVFWMFYEKLSEPMALLQSLIHVIAIDQLYL